MTEFVSLENLLWAQRPDRWPQALRQGELLDWAAWRRRVGQWRAVLTTAPGTVWALYHRDAFEFSAVLMALWASGKVACVPGSNQPRVAEGLRGHVQGFIGEFPEAVAPLPGPGSQAPVLDEDVLLDPAAQVMEIYTSGSSGEPQAIGKALFQLGEEVQRLEQLWGERVENSLAVATVSHHHIYGLLFRILWPLAAGRCFEAYAADYLEALDRPAEHWDRLTLVSSPSHLTRIPGGKNWSALRTCCRAVFSSGAPLPRQAALNTRRLLGQAPLEVYGSSETGGIAWRQQQPETEPPWQPVPDLETGVDAESGCLTIRSPYLPSRAPYVTSDRVERLDDGRFRLLGRADRIAKVEGKRLSLTEMEQRFLAHPCVAEARVVVLEGRRSEVGAAVVPTTAGRQILAEDGKRVLNSRLSDYLAAQFERPLLPRRWRYPEALPMDSQGKVTQASLGGLFTANNGEVAPTLPRVLSSESGDGAAELRLELPENLLYFRGHFPVAAILPGVVQIQWARYYGEQLLDFRGEFSHLEALKFQHVLRPGQQTQLSLKRSGTHKLSFRFQSAAGRHASGRLVLRGAESS